MAAQTQITLNDLLTLQQERELFISKISEPLVTQVEQQQRRDGTRNSDVSSAAEGTELTTPASLSADLEHYKELFTKLRFSYVEQTTKEKFLRAIVGEPFVHVTAAENAELEAHLATIKATLQSRKAEIATLIADLERQSRDISLRHQRVCTDTEVLVALPAEIGELQEKVELLTHAQAPESDNPALNVPLPILLAMLEERQAESERMDEQMVDYENEIEKKAEELRKLQEELGQLEAQRMDATSTAYNAGHQQNNRAKRFDEELEARGRWLGGVEATMRALLEVDVEG